jgi:hypothetical protein
MLSDPTDPRDIPILTDAVDQEQQPGTPIDLTALQSALTSETLKLADSLLHQAVQNIEATLFERVFDRLRAELPELVDRIVREHAGGGHPAPPGQP